MVFGLNRSGLEHTIYRTRGERANHYTKDAVDLKGEGTQSNTAFFFTEWNWLVLKIATCLSANSCFSELALCKSNWANWSSIKWTPSPFHWKLTCTSHHILPRFVQEVVANPLPYDHDTLPFYHIICMLYPKTEGMISYWSRDPVFSRWTVPF
jgi:hypothetical protein